MPRKKLMGVVVGNSAEKTLSVEVVRQLKHKKCHKIIKRSKKYLVHNPDPNCRPNLGDTVEIVECSPISKTKTWLIKS
jgi:small subunit ribosomal protein S17